MFAFGLVCLVHGFWCFLHPHEIERIFRASEDTVTPKRIPQVQRVRRRPIRADVLLVGHGAGEPKPVPRPAHAFSGIVRHFGYAGAAAFH